MLQVAVFGHVILEFIEELPALIAKGIEHLTVHVCKEPESRCMQNIYEYAPYSLFVFGGLVLLVIWGKSKERR